MKLFLLLIQMLNIEYLFKLLSNLIIKIPMSYFLKNLGNLLPGFTILLLLSSCYQNKAEIITNQTNIYSSKNYYKKNRIELQEISKNNLVILNNKKHNNLPTTKRGDIEDKKNSSHVVVNDGDTLYAISATYNVPNRDLIEINNLKEPYIIKEGQKLKLPSFKYHNVVKQENLYYIARIYDMNISELIKLNELKKPYNIKIGDKIRISETASIKRKSKKRIKKIIKKAPNIDNNNFIWPVKSGSIISKFGQKSGGLYNDGINIKPTDNNDVLSVRDGKIAYVGNELRGYGNLIIIKHGNDWISAYAHLDNILIKKGQKIRQGTKIATIGSTGNVLEKQLYFSLRYKKEAINPEKYLIK